MARETKISLLVGMVIILLVGILVSDHLSSANQREHGSLTTFGPKAQKSVASDIGRNGVAPAIPMPGVGQATPNDPSRSQQVGDPQPPSRLDIVPPPLGKDLVDARSMGHEQDPFLSGANSTTPGSALPVAGDAIPGGVGGGMGAAGDARVGIFGSAVRPTSPAQPTPLAKHVVQKGDTLYKLAARYYRDAGSWKLIEDANAAELKANRGNLKEGSTLIIPPRPNAPEVPAITQDQPGLFEQVTPERAPGASDGVPVRIIEVAAGQNLMAIAGLHLGDKNRWREILDANKDQIRKPEDLKIGMKLKMPAGTASASSRSRGDAPAPQPRTADARRPDRTERTTRREPQAYTVRAGDTLYSISQRHMGDRGRWKEIMAMNRGKLEGPNDLQIGQVIHLPSSGSH